MAQALSMPLIYVLDACALIAFLDREEGWERVKLLLEQAKSLEIRPGRKARLDAPLPGGLPPGRLRAVVMLTPAD